MTLQEYKRELQHSIGSLLPYADIGNNMRQGQLWGLRFALNLLEHVVESQPTPVFRIEEVS